MDETPSIFTIGARVKTRYNSDQIYTVISVDGALCTCQNAGKADTCQMTAADLLPADEGDA